MASPQTFHKISHVSVLCSIQTTLYKLQGSTIKHLHLLRWNAVPTMTSNRGRPNLYEPLTIVRVSRQRSDTPLSQEAESLVNLFSHAYDHSYDLLRDTDDIRCITRALGLSMEAVKAARTARSSQEDADNNAQSSGDNREDSERNEDEEGSEDIEGDEEEYDGNDNLHQPPPQITQPERHMNDSDIEEDEGVDSDSTDADSFIAEESMHSEGTSGSGDLTDSEYDDDVSEVSLRQP